jgi:hypothetical protein
MPPSTPPWPARILPDDLAVAIGIHRERNSRLLSDHQQIPAAGAGERRRAAEVVVGTNHGGAVGIAAAAVAHVHVVGRHLARPPDRSRVHVERDDGVARWLRRAAVGIAGCRVEQAPAPVHGRCRPDGRSGRTPQRHARAGARARGLGKGLPTILADISVPLTIPSNCLVGPARPRTRGRGLACNDATTPSSRCVANDIFVVERQPAPRPPGFR